MYSLQNISHTHTHMHAHTHTHTPHYMYTDYVTHDADLFPISECGEFITLETTISKLIQHVL